MWARLKAAWHDPVGSKVIATAIVGTPALVWAARAVILSGVSGAITQAGAGALGVAGWLVGPASVPRWLLLVIVVSVVLLLFREPSLLTKLLHELARLIVLIARRI
jgi:hypothetical protein